MPTERSLYSDHSRAVKIVGRDVRHVLEHMHKEAANQPAFMKQRSSAPTERMYQTIRNSKMAAQLYSEGYPLPFVRRVAQMDKQRQGQQLVDQVTQEVPGGQPL